ncbi:MAG: DUF5662 family protein [Candidatus Methylomirabilales bacterium]
MKDKVPVVPVGELAGVIAQVLSHRAEVQDALATVIYRLEQRSRRHDLSKFRGDELAGFARISRLAKEHPYGSPEYRAALREEKPTIHLHYSRNPHHPEFYRKTRGETGGMTLLDLIEMAADWWSAWRVYELERKPEDRMSWEASVERNIERFSDLSDHHLWVVRQVVGLLGEED